MKSPPIAIFGVPIHNYSVDEVVTVCVEHLITAASISHPLFIHPITSSDISEVLGWRPHIVRDPELIRVLRSGNMNIAQHRALQWVSSALGCPLKPSIDIKELLIKLCTKLGARERGVFILGNQEKVHKAAAVNLHERCSGLRIVGIVNSPVTIAGEGLVNADDKDNLLVEQINATSADLLLLALDEAEQDIWLERVRQKLKVPLILCVGSALDELLPSKKSDPYVSSQKKDGLFKRALTGLKTMGITIPLVAYHRINEACFNLLYKKKNEVYNPTSLLFLSQQRAIAAVALPKIIDSSTIQEISKRIEDAQMHNILILDFRPVCHIQPEGFAMLLHYWRRQQHHNRQFYGFAPSADILVLMQLHRVWDYFKDNMCMSTESLLSRIGHGPTGAEFFDSIYQHGDQVELSFFGGLNNAIDYDAYFHRLKPILDNKNCVLDFSYCSYIDNTGFIFLLKIRQLIAYMEKQLSVRNMSKNTLAQFQRTGVAALFKSSSAKT